MSDLESLEWESDPDLDPDSSLDDDLDLTSIVQGHCNELEIICPEFRTSCRFVIPNSAVRVRIALLPSALIDRQANISSEYLAAIGHDMNRALILELHVEDASLDVSNLSVGSIHMNELNLFDKEIAILSCALSRPLTERVQKYVKDHWRRDLIRERSQQFQQVAQIISVTRVNYHWALTALAACNYDANDAILTLTGIDSSLLHKSMCTEERASSEALVKRFQSADRVVRRSCAVLMLILCHWDLDLAVGLMRVPAIRAMVQSADKSLNVSGLRSISLITMSNPIADLANSFQHRFLTLNETCYLCNGPLPIAILRLGICDSPLCNHQFEECGIGFSLEEEICRQPELCDLLISMCASASKGDRLSIFFPKALRDPISGSTLSSDPNGLQEIGKILEQCPSVQEMSELAIAGILIQHLRKCHPLLPSLLRWIFASNRSHIRLLDECDRVDGITACYQFVLLTSSPKKEALLKQHIAESRRDCPVQYAFHGSPQSNWHSIVRQGLLNMSGTKHQLNGASYGQGIYMAPNLQTSLGYSRGNYSCGSNTGWSNSVFGQDWSAVALCEVANTASLQSPNPFWVVPNADMVVTRYLFIFKSQEVAKQIDIDSRKHFTPDLSAKFRNLSK